MIDPLGSVMLYRVVESVVWTALVAIYLVGGSDAVGGSELLSSLLVVR